MACSPSLSLSRFHTPSPSPSFPLQCKWVSPAVGLVLSPSFASLRLNTKILIRLFTRLIDESQCFQCKFEFPDYLIKNYTQHIAQVCWGYSGATLSLARARGNLIDFCAKTHWHADLISASRKCLSVITYRQAQLAYLHSEQVTYHICMHGDPINPHNPAHDRSLCQSKGNENGRK